MGSALVSVGTQMAGASKMEAPDYTAIYDATGDSVSALQGQSHDILNRSAEEQALIGEVGAFETGKLISDWENQVAEISQKQEKTLSSMGFASTGIVEQEFDKAREVAGKEKDYQVRGADTSMAMANIENQINQMLTSFAGATGYSWEEGGPPQESVGCMGQIERDQSYG